MSLINNDFRLNHQRLNAQSEQHRGPLRLRWALFALVAVGIGAVIASTGTESVKSDDIASESLPEFTQVENPTDELARESYSLSLPELQAKQKIIDEAKHLEPKEWSEHTVKSGDSLARLFKRANIKPQQLDELMKSGEDVKTLRKIFPKDTIRVLADDDGTLQALHYEIDQKSYLLVERKDGELVAEIFEHDIEVRQAHASGVIDSSLFIAAQKAGISQNVIMELANIFGWDIDFVLDIRKGDSFTVLYEEEYLDGEKIADGDILAADFVNDGKIYRAVRYTNPQTNAVEYYTPDGKSMRKAFLRSPVDFTRISSRFSKARKHPILSTTRAHRGVDYAAPQGTPIKAAGDGKIIHRANKGGYGKTVIIQHGTKYKTLYAHLKNYNRKARLGTRVKQGQVIGYVGQTGTATGPHLHYEFRVNGVHRNPLTVRLPDSQPVPKKHLEDFDLKTSPIIAQLDAVTRPTQLALTEDQ